VQSWVNELSGRLAPASVRRCYPVFAQLLDAAVEMGLLTVSPASRVRLPRISRAEMRYLTPPELERLADAIDPRGRALVLVMAWATFAHRRSRRTSPRGYRPARRHSEGCQ
jgi:integrase